jgi:uncharacterized membrane protein
MGALLGFVAFAAAWACGWIADRFKETVLKDYQGEKLADRLRDAVAVAWFVGCFLLARWFIVTLG